MTMIRCALERAEREKNKKGMKGQVCHWCEKRVGYTIHEIYRRKKDWWWAWLWVCVVCDQRKGPRDVHGCNENVLRKAQCKQMIKHRPEMKELVHKQISGSTNWAK